MKELSTEEKARRYDEAIERVKNIKTGKYETTFIFTEGLFEHIFPELEESEDERIRKQIISFLKEFEYDHYRCLDFSSWIAWLEKQSNNADKVKQQQAIEIPFGAKDSELQEATYHIPDGYHAEINGNEVVIKKGEQKTTWKPTEEQIEALEHFLETIRRYEYSYFHEETFLWLHSLLEQLKKL